MFHFRLEGWNLQRFVQIQYICLCTSMYVCISLNYRTTYFVTNSKIAYTSEFFSVSTYISSDSVYYLCIYTHTYVQLPFLTFSITAVNAGGALAMEFNCSQKSSKLSLVFICSMRQSSILWLAVNTSLHSSILPI